MRLNKTVVTERENFVRDLFRVDLKLTGGEVQAKLKERFGKIMRPNRIYELKREVVQELLAAPVPAVTSEPVVDANGQLLTYVTTPVDTQVTVS